MQTCSASWISRWRKRCARTCAGRCVWTWPGRCRGWSGLRLARSDIRPVSWLAGSSRSTRPGQPRPARPTAPGLANRARLRRPTLSDLGGAVRPTGVHPAHRHTSIISAARMVPAISGDPPPRTLAHLNQRDRVTSVPRASASRTPPLSYGFGTKHGETTATMSCMRRRVSAPKACRTNRGSLSHWGQ
jgi:hypothetical protein